MCIHLWSGLLATTVQYTPYEGPKSANQVDRKLGVFDMKLEGSHSIFTDILIKLILDK